MSWHPAPEGGRKHAKKRSSGGMFNFMETLVLVIPGTGPMEQITAYSGKISTVWRPFPKERWVNMWRKSMDSVKKLRHISMYHRSWRIL
jgi:hypothetical protein